MTVRAELLDCPFCRAPAESDSQQAYRALSSGKLGTACAIYCTRCDAIMTICLEDVPGLTTEEVINLLIEKWNTRADQAQLSELERLRGILNTPVLEPFTTAVISEAQHQVYRWGAEHDAKKTAWDWFWLLGHLGGKAAHSALLGDWVKAKHHTITTAAVLANWHRQLCEQEGI